MTDDASAIPPELIEQYRTIGLRLDRDGQFWHQGVRIEHARLRQALLRWLDVRADGRDLVRLDAERYAYVTVDDAHLRVTAARWQDDRLRIWLDDGSDEELAYATLATGADGGLACLVRGGRLRARFTTSAQQSALERVDLDDDRPVMCAAGQRWPIASVG